MKIIILGVNQVGESLAENLARENEVTLVDADSASLDSLRTHLDIRTVTGHPAHPAVLADAGAEDADLLLAVTGNDEINIVACQVAYTLFRVPTRIGRFRSRAYLDRDDLFDDKAVPVNVRIYPEQLVTEAICRLLEFPEALQVLDFADGRVELVAVRVLKDSPLAGHELRDLPHYMPDGTDGRVAAIFRSGKAIVPQGDTAVTIGDEVFFIAARQHIRSLLHALHPMDPPSRRIIIGGGGNIGERLAAAIEKDHQVTVVETLRARCEQLSETLDRAVVLHGSTTDRDLLQHENIHTADVFCALTNDDAVNIMSSLVAKDLGVRKVITIINDIGHADLLHGEEIDIALSPRQFTISSILTHMRRGDLSAVHSLRRGAAEAMELVVHGDHRSSQVVGKTVAELPMPEAATIGAIVRGEEVIIAHRNVRIETDDHLILFLAERSCVGEVETLFQADFNFF